MFSIGNLRNITVAEHRKIVASRTAPFYSHTDPGLAIVNYRPLLGSEVLVLLLALSGISCNEYEPEGLAGGGYSIRRVSYHCLRLLPWNHASAGYLRTAETGIVAENRD